MKLTFVKISMSIIHTIYNVNLYFYVKYNSHFKFLNALIPWSYSVVFRERLAFVGWCYNNDRLFPVGLLSW